MGGFLGIGGKNSQQQNQAVGNLNNLFNFGFSTGQKGVGTGGGTQQQGLSALGDATSYFKNLASGNRAAVQTAAAPEINATQSAADAARRQQAASGTARGGGVAATNQQAREKTQAQIDNALFGVRPQAAAQEAQVGGKIADVGSQQMEQALQALGLAGTSTAQAGDIATQARQQAAQEQASLISDILGFGKVKNITG